MVPWYGTVSVSLSSQQETAESMQCKQNYGHCDDDLNAHVGTGICRSWNNGQTKFCQKLGKTVTETFQMIQQVYGDALSRSVVFRWHRRFSQGRNTLEEDVRTGRPQTVRIERKISQ